MREFSTLNCNIFERSKEFHISVKYIKGTSSGNVFSIIHSRDTPYTLYALRARRKHDMKKIKLCMRVACTKRGVRNRIKYVICILLLFIVIVIIIIIMSMLKTRSLTWRSAARRFRSRTKS